jgi:hypothetical protein
MLMTQVAQKVKLIEGQFSTSEASDLISSLIDQKINFHKIQRLGQLIHDDTIDVEESRERIAQLTKEKMDAKQLIANARVKGRKITIKSHIEISYDD